MNTQPVPETRLTHRHNGNDYLIDKHGKCWFCGQIVNDTKEDEVPVLAESNTEVDIESGEVFRQETLDPEMFPASERRQVPMVKIGFSGSVEMTQSEWQAYCDQGLEPGREVKVTLVGWLPDPHAKWVKRSEKDELGSKNTWWEQEGQVKVKALELGGFELRGYHDGE